MQEIVTALGLLLVLEGLMYAVAPGGMRSVAEMVSQMEPDTLRNVGLATVAGGLVVVWCARVLLAG